MQDTKLILQGRIELAFSRNNLEEALAAVESAWQDVEHEADKVCATTPIALTPLEVRIACDLGKANIHYLGQLVKMTDGDLFQLRNIGSKQITKIRKMLKEVGFE